MLQFDFFLEHFLTFHLKTVSLLIADTAISILEQKLKGKQ